jgi:hypothetical protein
MSIIFSPNQFLYYDKLKNHDILKEKLFSKITQLKDNEEIVKNKTLSGCILKTSFLKENFHQFLYEELIVKNIVWDPIDKLINKYNKLVLDIFKLKIKDSIIKEAWFNYYDKNNFQEVHTHKAPSIILNNTIYKPSFSLIYILHDENKNNNTIFKFPSNEFNYDFIINSDIINTGNIKNISEGTVIIFPFNFEHYVIPVSKNRITLAYNVYSSV